MVAHGSQRSCTTAVERGFFITIAVCQCYFSCDFLVIVKVIIFQVFQLQFYLQLFFQLLLQLIDISVTGTVILNKFTNTQSKVWGDLSAAGSYSKYCHTALWGFPPLFGLNISQTLRTNTNTIQIQAKHQHTWYSVVSVKYLIHFNILCSLSASK